MFFDISSTYFYTLNMNLFMMWAPVYIFKKETKKTKFNLPTLIKHISKYQACWIRRAA